MFLAEIHPVAPAAPPHASIGVWVVVAVLLALVIASGMVLSSRR